MRVRVTVPSIAALAAWLLFPLLAAAHAHLGASEPADGSTLARSPENFILNFSESAQLTSLTLLKAGDPEPRKIEALPAVTSTRISTPAPSLGAGVYELHYRVLSADGHVMSGTVHFTIAIP